MIVVIGSTGSTGSNVVKELVAKGEQVRAAARDPKRARALFSTMGIDPARVEVVPCDVERTETLAPALRGAQKAYVALGGPGGVRDLLAAERGVIDAALHAGIRHYVKVSGIGARPSGVTEIEQLHGAIAEHLLASGLPCTILEPSFFMQNFLGLAPAIGAGVLPLPTGAGKAALIDARDIARVAAVVLTSGAAHLGGRYVLTGPELLGHDDAARLMSSVLERPVAYQDVPQRAFEGSLEAAGVPAWFAHRLADVYANLLRPGGAARVTGEVERITGAPPRSLGAFLRDHRAAFVS